MLPPGLPRDRPIARKLRGVHRTVAALAQPEPVSQLLITVKAYRPIAVVSLTGDLDMATAPRLATHLERLNGDVRLDCAGLSFIDSSGLEVLVRAHQAMNDRGRQLLIGGLSPLCRQPFEVTGLAAVLNLI
jgi:anti-sigma B factor antagonist